MKNTYNVAGIFLLACFFISASNCALLVEIPGHQLDDTRSDAIIVTEYKSVMQLELLYAIQQNNAMRAKNALEKGARVDIPYLDGSYPLHVAALYDVADVARVLLAYDADPAQINRAGKLPHELAPKNSTTRALLEDALYWPPLKK